MAGQAQNKRTQSNNSSGFEGISFDNEKKKWHAYVNVKRKRHFLGYHAYIKDAVRARNEFIIKNGLDFKIQKLP